MGVYHFRDGIGEVACDLLLIYELALGKSDKYFEKLKSVQCTIGVLIHVIFFKVSRLEISVNDSCMKRFIRNSSLQTEHSELPFLDVWRAVKMRNYLDEDLFEFRIVLFEDIFYLFLLF